MNIRSVLAVVAAAIVLSSAIQASAQSVNILNNPTWIETPDTAAIERHFPKAALAARSHGVASLDCVVMADGHLSECRPVHESPKGLGFADAALELAQYFRARTTTVDGASVEGASVRVHIAMQLPASAGPTSMPPPPPPMWQLPAGARPTIITSPDWKSIPTGSDMARAYPRQAWQANVEGRAVIRCLVRTSGRLERCAVVSETPSDFGFGEAAMQMASRFELKPMTRDGQPVDGGQVTIPIVFKLPPLPAPAQ